MTILVGQRDEDMKGRRQERQHGRDGVGVDSSLAHDAMLYPR